MLAWHFLLSHPCTAADGSCGNIFFDIDIHLIHKYPTFVVE